LVVTFAEEWYNHFEEEYYKYPFPKEKAKWGTWTKRTLSLIKKIGKTLGYNIKIEKPVRVDMSWFDKRYFEPQVVIEYETIKTGILDDELLNLACSSARLKVLITYIEEKEIDYYLKEIIGRWETRGKRVWNDELLVIFCIYTPAEGFRFFEYYIGYVIYPVEGKLQTKELKQILS